MTEFLRILGVCAAMIGYLACMFLCIGWMMSSPSVVSISGGSVGLVFLMAIYVYVRVRME